MTVVFEHIRDQDHYVRSILSDVKPMKTLTAEQQLQHAVATTCEVCHWSFTMKNKKTKHHYHLSGYYIGPYCNTCNLKLKYKKIPTPIRIPDEEQSGKKKTNKVHQWDIQKIHKKGRRRCQSQQRSGHRWLHDDGGFIHDTRHIS